MKTVPPDMRQTVYPVYDNQGRLVKVYLRHHAAINRAGKTGTYRICLLCEV